MHIDVETQYYPPFRSGCTWSFIRCACVNNERGYLARVLVNQAGFVNFQAQIVEQSGSAVIHRII